METKSNNGQDGEKTGVTNIVGETKKIIFDETDSSAKKNKQQISDDDIKRALEMINPDPNSLKSRG